MGRVDVQSLCESAEGIVGRLAGGNHSIYGSQSGSSDLVRMHRNQNASGESLWDSARDWGPRRWQQMVSLVDNDPVRARSPGAPLKQKRQQRGKIPRTFSHVYGQ